MAASNTWRGPEDFRWPAVAACSPKPPWGRGADGGEGEDVGQEGIANAALPQRIAQSGLPALKDLCPAVIGLGYVGLPLAMALAQTRPTIGYDLSRGRIAALRDGTDTTGEVAPDRLSAARKLPIRLTDQSGKLTAANCYIVTVPTPIDAHKRPDLAPLLKACAQVGAVLSPGNLVIFESTVYPGATEDDCVPALERASGLRLNRDFWVGYSPERTNPGDPAHRLQDVVKVTSGSTPDAAGLVDALYRQIITAGTHPAPSIRVAEAAKVIENTQRDLNIALVNELAMIFDRLDLDTEAVLEAAGTKWNFLPFRPGLVGGHCIGVDPYYLTHKARAAGHEPEVILAGRRLNDRMGAWCAARLVRAMSAPGRDLTAARVLIMGLTFKENCPDLRNTGVLGLIEALCEHGLRVDVHDPLADPDVALADCDVDLIAHPVPGLYDAVVLAVAHQAFRALGPERLRALGKPGALIYDLKGMLPPECSDLRL
ncbi:MAG: nucleotide sugar dehydrogenase [Rhodobacteraceae bacterium]|nr:nucleotide sugar dehydrogenase [Paracoccaceae bacterium]